MWLRLILSVIAFMGLTPDVAQGAKLLDSPFSAMDWQSLEWSELLTENGISIATAKREGSDFVAVKSSMRVEARLNDIAALVLFVDGCHEGTTVCEKIEKKESRDPQHYFQYVVSKFPWPLRKRDIFLRISVDQDTQGVIRVDGKAFPDKFPENKHYVRIKTMDLQWKITPEANGVVLIEHFIHSNPSGRVPAFLFNDAVASTPLKTLANIKRLLSLEKYQQRNIAFIQELFEIEKLPKTRMHFN